MERNELIKLIEEYKENITKVKELGNQICEELMDQADKKDIGCEDAIFDLCNDMEDGQMSINEFITEMDRILSGED